MKHYRGIDGLVLCVIKGKIDIQRWISEIDMLDHSIIPYEELINSINNLINGGIIYYKNQKFRLSQRAKFILFGRLLMGAIDWQLKVQERIQKYSYKEENVSDFYFSRKDYDIALNNYFKSFGI